MILFFQEARYCLYSKHCCQEIAINLSKYLYYHSFGAIFYFSKISITNQSFFRNPGQLGGQIYADLDFIYDFNKEIYFGFSVKNLLNSDAISLPLSPKTPRQYVVETGYRFN